MLYIYEKGLSRVGIEEYKNRFPKDPNTKVNPNSSD
jgi:hypothetical protein